MDITVKDFEKWLAGSAAGDEFVYHAGTTIPERMFPLATHIRQAFEQHVVSLFQRRITEGGQGIKVGALAYIARRRAVELPVSASCPAEGAAS
jgi:hypothetical protein